jgi:molybdopterin-containing oxidoreductase family iron-sulfur binding subunit
MAKSTDSEKTVQREDLPGRREIIKLTAGAAALAATMGLSARAEQIEASIAPPVKNKPLPPFPNISAQSEPDVLMRMQDELRQALMKPLEERRWNMVMDLRKCIGCHSCTVACISENQLPPGVVYRYVTDEEFGSYPNVVRRFTPRPCMHCEEPVCTPVCPVKATFKQADGTVVINYERCIGCRFCIVACPYGARTFDFGDRYVSGTLEAAGLIVGHEKAGVWEHTASFEYATKHERTAKRDSPIGNARKCQFCLHRVEMGMLPACTATCIGRATYFGDANNPDSLVSELIARPETFRLKEELGLKPAVHYLI